jgi:DNA replication and repair protein RecF
MRLLSLALQDFRNITQAELRPGQRFNVVHGDNAQGKTNLLEAIYVLSFLRSFRTRRSADLVRWDSEATTLAAHVEDGGIETRVRLSIRRGERVLEVDGKRVRSPMSYYGTLRVVFFGPDDLDLTKGAPEVRRRYLDRILFLSESGYWNVVRGYTEALGNRNRLLQQGTQDQRLLRSFDPQLAELGADIIRRRARVVERVAEIVDERLPGLARWQGDGLAVRYRSSIPEGSREPEAYRALLAERLEADARRGFTGVGPHKDDIGLAFGNGRSFRQFASQGQHRLLAILLKITELEVLQRVTGSYPVLLLDDVSSELDRGHYELLKRYMEGGGDQVFLTTTDPDVLPRGPDIHYYHAAAGIIRTEADDERQE